MNNAPGDGRTPATVELLAAYKKLPPGWLHKRFGLSDDHGGVSIPYLPGRAGASSSRRRTRQTGTKTADAKPPRTSMPSLWPRRAIVANW